MSNQLLFGGTTLGVCVPNWEQASPLARARQIEVFGVKGTIVQLGGVGGRPLSFRAIVKAKSARAIRDDLKSFNDLINTVETVKIITSSTTTNEIYKHCRYDNHVIVRQPIPDVGGQIISGGYIAEVVFNFYQLRVE